MAASTEFLRIYTKKRLKELYLSDVRYKTATGIDRINRKAFESKLDENIDVVYRKIRNGSYKFTPYREKLILRGSKKLPRVVSIPTIRDKLALKALFEVLHNVYKNESPFIHRIINEITLSLRDNLFDCVLRLDVKDFYPSINHKILLQQLKKKVRKNEILHCLNSAIRQPTVPKIKKGENTHNDTGIPQGLSISNILANIYFRNIDEKYNNMSDIKYVRYVDDILILCDCLNLDMIRSEIETDCKLIKLKIHGNDSEKSVSCSVQDRFSYLGYVFENKVVSVRKKSIDKLRESIIKLFTNYKYSESRNLALLKWALDLRITGCIFNETKYGWLFFFSQINDLKLLKSLDLFIEKLLVRFNINPASISLKKFTRSFHEITKNLSHTSYIPNFDQYRVSKKRRILKEIFKIKTRLMTSADIEYQFNKKLYKTVKDLERDLARAS